MREDAAEDFAFAAVRAGGRGGDDDALGVDHLPHHTARAVGRADEQRVEAELLATMTRVQLPQAEFEKLLVRCIVHGGRSEAWPIGAGLANCHWANRHGECL